MSLVFQFYSATFSSAFLNKKEKWRKFIQEIIKKKNKPIKRIRDEKPWKIIVINLKVQNKKT